MSSGIDLLALLIGIVFAAAGGELFVKGAVAVGHWLRIPAAAVGATIAAFATSSPEVSVAISSSAAGRPGIALGDALGSNVVNVALILGIALLAKPVGVEGGKVKRELMLAVAAPALTGLLLLDGVLGRVDAAVLAVVFVSWLVSVVRGAQAGREAMSSGEASRWRAIGYSIAGLALLVGAGRLIVIGAVAISTSLGISPFLVGALIVSFGTSVPELATVVVSKLRGQDDIGIGTILGSNLFNNLFIVSIAAFITPIAVPLSQVMIALVFGVVSVAVLFAQRGGELSRTHGGALLAIYALYIVASWWAAGMVGAPADSP